VCLFSAPPLFIRTFQTLGAAVIYSRTPGAAPRYLHLLNLHANVLFSRSLSSSPLRIGFGFIALIDSINPALCYLEHKIYMGYKCVWGHPGPGVKIARVEFHLGHLNGGSFFAATD
jgi:hypothetical protein